MGQEIWFRGEAVGVAQAAGKTNPHDFVDGMYLTDQPRVAVAYAETRTSDASARRVWSASIDLKGLKVLDLTTDPRWEKHIAPPKPGLPGGETMIKMANENYGRYFKSFVEKEKIDLSKIDVIIGKEYVRGGRQLCIVHKNGQASPLAVQVRATFRPLPAKPASLPSIVPRTLPARGRIGAGLKVAGGAALMIGASFLSEYVWARVLGKILDDEMKKIEPQVRKAVEAKVADIAELLSNGRPAYAAVTIVITEGDFGLPEGGSAPLPPKVELIRVEVSERPVSREGPERRETAFRTHVTKREVQYSFPVELTEAELELYRAYRVEMQWFEAQLEDPGLSHQDLARLNKDRNELAERLAAALRP